MLRFGHGLSSIRTMYRYSRSFLPRQERSKEADLGGERHDRRLWRRKGVERVAEVCKIKPASSGADFAGNLNRTHFASCSSLLVAFFGTFLCNHKKVRIICTWCAAIITRDRCEGTGSPSSASPCGLPPAAIKIERSAALSTPQGKVWVKALGDPSARHFVPRSGWQLDWLRLSLFTFRFFGCMIRKKPKKAHYAKDQ